MADVTPTSLISNNGNLYVFKAVVWLYFPDQDQKNPKLRLTIVSLENHKALH